MVSVNEVTLIGRIGRDPEVRFTSGGKAVANFTLATDESYKDAQGEWQKKTEWHNLVVWGPAVEKFVQPYLHKGDLIYVRGKLQTRQWDDKDGQKRTKTEVNVLEIQSCTPKESGSGNSNTQTSNKPATQNRANTSRPTQQRTPAPIADEDIPF